MNKTLNEIMELKNVSTVSKMIYSYLRLSTQEKFLIITKEGFNKMFQATVSSSESITVNECFNELIANELIKLKSIQDDGIEVYELYNAEITN